MPFYVCEALPHRRNSAFRYQKVRRRIPADFLSDIFFFNKQTADKLLYIARNNDISCEKTEFLEEIHKVRKQGYALDENEYDHGIICISIPIYNSNGKIDFAMSVTDLILYTKAEELINLKDQLDEVSRKVSNAINYI